MCASHHGCLESAVNGQRLAVFLLQLCPAGQQGGVQRFGILVLQKLSEELVVLDTSSRNAFEALTIASSDRFENSWNPSTRLLR